MTATGQRQHTAPGEVERLIIDCARRLTYATGKPVSVYRETTVDDWDRELEDGGIVEVRTTYVYKFTESIPPANAEEIAAFRMKGTRIAGGVS